MVSRGRKRARLLAAQQPEDPLGTCPISGCEANEGSWNPRHLELFALGVKALADRVAAAEVEKRAKVVQRRSKAALERQAEQDGTEQQEKQQLGPDYDFGGGFEDYYDSGPHQQPLRSQSQQQPGGGGGAPSSSHAGSLDPETERLRRALGGGSSSEQLPAGGGSSATLGTEGSRHRTGSMGARPLQREGSGRGGRSSSGGHSREPSVGLEASAAASLHNLGPGFLAPFPSLVHSCRETLALGQTSGPSLLPAHSP